MRRLAMVIGIILGIFVAMLLAGYLWLQQQIEQSPIENLHYQVGDFGTSHLALDELSFSIAGNQLAVREVQVRWHWQNWRPQLDSVRLAEVNAVVTQWPEATATVEPETPTQLPESWQVPDWLPHELHIAKLTAQLPCPASLTGNGCVYSGSLQATQPLAIEAEDDVQVRLVLQPGEELSTRTTGLQTDQQLAVTLNYQVIQDFPVVELSARLPQQFDLQVTSELQSAANDSVTTMGDIQLTAEPPVGWLLDELALWQLTGPDSVDEALATYNEATADADDGGALLMGNWRMQFDPNVTTVEALRDATGEVHLALQSPSKVVLPGIGWLQGHARAALALVDGEVDFYDVNAEGELTEFAYQQQLRDYGLEVDALAWSVQGEGQQQPTLSALPLKLALTSVGETELQLNSELSLNADDMSVSSAATELSLTQPEWQWATDGLTTQLENLSVSTALRFDFVNDGQTFNVAAISPLVINAEASVVKTAVQAEEQTEASDLDIAVERIAFTMRDWEAHGQLDEMTVEFSGAADLAVNQLEHELLLPLDWRWQSEIAGAYNDDGIAARVTDGALSHNEGLKITHEVSLSPDELQLNYQLSDLFFLGGNPLAFTTSSWPELFSLGRGRLAAAGELVWPLGIDDPQASDFWQLTTAIQLTDVSGIYDTTEFTGLTATVDVNVADGELTVETDNAELQKLQQGLEFGPLRLAANYQAPMDDLLEGVFTLTDNQLAMFGGLVSLPNQVYDLGAKKIRVLVTIEKIDLSALFQQYPAADLSGNGTLSGTIPIRYSSEGIAVEAGLIGALAPGGKIQMQSQKAEAMAQGNQGVRVLVDALEDFHYSVLESGVSYQEDGTLFLALRIEGYNPAVQQGQIVKLNITLEEDLPALITSLQLTDKVNTIIQERVQQRLLQSKNP